MCCGEEFRWRNFLFGHDDPTLFVTSQWPVPHSLFVTYRLLLAVYCLGGQVYMFLADEHPNNPNDFPYPVYLTNWSFLLLTVYCTLAAVTVVVETGRGGSCGCSARRRDYQQLEGENGTRSSEVCSEDHKLAWYLKLQWLLFDVNILASLVVTVIFWTFLVPSLKHAVDSADYIAHATNSMLTVLEIAFTAIPIRFLHIIYPSIYLLGYVAFSAIFWSLDKSRVIYPILDWNTPGATIEFICAGLAAAIGVWCVLFLLVKGRVALARHRSNTRA